MKYHKVDIQKIREDVDRGYKYKLWKPKTGENRIRILPPWSEEGRFYRQIFVHFRVGVDNRVVVCPRRTPPRKGACAICEYIDAKLRSGSSIEQTEAQQMIPRHQFLYNIVDLKEPEKGVQVFASGVKIWNWLVGFFNNEEFGDFTDPMTGRTVIITKSGEGRQVEYTVALSPKQTPLDNMEWLNQLYNLDNYMPIATYEETKEALTGVLAVPVEEGEDDEEEHLDFGPFPDSDAILTLPSCFGRFNGGPKCLDNCSFIDKCVEEMKSRLGRGSKVTL